MQILTKKLWKFSNVCVTDISVINNFICIKELIGTDKSDGMNFLIYMQQIYLLIINLLILNN